MHCPKCNTQLAPGNVYCPSCGHEVQIVPDYDPLDEVLWDGPENEKKQKKNSSVTVDASEKKKKKSSLKDYMVLCWKDPLLRKISLLGLGLVFCVGVALTAYVMVRRQGDYEYQLRQGMECYEQGQFEDAILYLKKAQELQNEETRNDERPVRYLARVYRKMEENDMAAELLESLLDFSMGEKQKLELYEELFSVLQESGEADLINELIDSCNDDIIRKRLQPYRIEKPKVSIAGGVYYHYIYPKLEAAYGTIYYTLDGSTPTADSIQYNGRIELQEGDNLLTAIAINEKGIVSEQLFVAYTLDFDQPVDMSNKNDSIKYN